MFLAKNIKYLVAVLAFAVVTISCDKKEDKTPPVLSVPFINTGDTVRILAFGHELTPGRFNPAYEVITTNQATQVLSATSGKVTRIEYNGGGSEGQNDYEVFVQPKKDSIFVIIYDHVRNVAVSKGSRVTPGTVLGTVGWWGATEGRIEIQINNNNTDRAICPETYGTDAFNLAFEAALATSNTGLSPGDHGYFASLCLSPTVVP